MSSIPTKNLTAFFPLSAIGESDVCNDLSGNMHPLKTQNAPQIITDNIFGSVLNLSDINQGLFSEVSSFENAFIAGSTQFSITMWAYPTQNNGVLAYYKSDNEGFVLYLNGGNLCLNLGEQSMATSATVKLNTWNFLAVTYSKTEVYLIVNEHTISFSINNPDGLVANQSALIVGNNANYSDAFIGYLSHFRVYNLTLSITDLIQVMKQDLLAALRIYLPFNKLNNNNSPNISQYPYFAYMQGQPTLQIDNLLSLVTKFNGEGDYFAIDGYFYENQGEIGEISVSFWLKANAIDSLQTIASFDGTQFWEISLDNEGKLLWITTDRYGNTDTMTSNALVANGLWQYVSVMYQTGTGQKSIYLGKDLDSQTLNTHIGQPLGNHSVTRYGTIGVNNTGDSFNKNIGTQFLQGSLAQFRIQHSILTTANIQLNMANSYPAAASFQAYYPLSFNFNNGDDENTFYISDDTTKHLVSLNITNDSDTTIKFSTQQSVDESNFQIAIYFAEGTLDSDLSSQISLLENIWNISPLTSLENGRMVLYINYCGEDDFYLDPYITIQLHLSNLYASETGGSRTARIGIQYDNLTQNTNPITGSEEIVVDIVNNKGKQQLPLHLGFVDTNTVLNNGLTGNTLTVRIMNIMTDENGSITINGQNNDIPSTFYFIFDMSDDTHNNWALNNKGSLKSADFVVSDNNWQITPNFEGEIPYWILKTNSNISLGVGAYIDITISGLVANTSAAFSNLYIAYHNIPGYWDGKWVLPIIKSPIVVRGQSVGINAIPNGNVLFALGDPKNGIGYDSTFPLKMMVNNNPVLTLDSSGNCSVQGVLTANSGLTVNGGLTANNGLNVGNGINLYCNQQNQSILNLISNTSAGAVNPYISASGNVLNIHNSSSSLSLNSSGAITVHGTTTFYNDINLYGDINASSNTLNIKNINASGGNLVFFSSIGMQSDSQLNMENRSTLNVKSGSTLSIQSGSTLTIASGLAVTGIPIIDFKVITLSDSSKQGSGTLSGNVSFANTVLSAEVVLKSWSLNYTDSNNHYSYYNQVSLSCTNSGSTVTITATVDLGDQTNNDGYSVSIDVVVIARLQQTI